MTSLPASLPTTDRSLSAGPVVRSASRWRWAVLAAVGIAGLAVRIVLYPETSSDYTSFVSPWYDHLKAGGGFPAVGDDFANYNVPYLYLLAAVTYLPIAKIVAIKSISVVFDLLLAFFAYRIAAQKSPGWRPVVAASVLWVAPTVIVNSAEWAQCDSIYGSLCLGGLYFLLRRKPVWAAVLIGLAFSFKLQAVFFLPVALLVVIVQQLPWRRVVAVVLMVPVMYVVTLIPALAAGASWKQLLSIYPNQVASPSGAGTGGTGTAGSGGGTAGGTAAPGGGLRGGTGFGGGGRGGGSGDGFGGGSSGTDSSGTNNFTYNAPNFFQWVGSSASVAWKYLGFLLTGLSVAAVWVISLLRRKLTSDDLLLLAASTILIAVPFFLPGMHERYFYLADVVTLVTACRVVAFLPVAVIVQACSLLAYAPFLWHTAIVPLWLAAVLEAIALAGAFTVLVRKARVTGQERSTEPVPVAATVSSGSAWPAR